MLGETVGPVSYVVADVCADRAADWILDECLRRHGKIDIVINNVGGLVGSSRLLDSSDEDWRRAVELNLLQVVAMTRAAAARMIKRGGSITTIGSVSGRWPQIGRSGQYGGCKAALVYLTERWALELTPHNIRVNLVSPGSTMCVGNGWDAYRQRNPAGFEEYRQHAFPAGRLGTPEEIADVVVFMSSARAGWLNGTHILVDGLQQPYETPERRLDVKWRAEAQSLVARDRANGHASNWLRPAPHPPSAAQDRAVP
jgi:3-oxoacyl-[acyl-carrier protein] reductase